MKIRVLYLELRKIVDNLPSDLVLFFGYKVFFTRKCLPVGSFTTHLTQFDKKVAIILLIC